PRASSDITQAAQCGLRYLLHAPAGAAGGASCHTPWEPRLVKLEYGGHDYGDEVRAGRLGRDARVNVGLLYPHRPGVRITLGWERGNELLATLTLRGNLTSSPRPTRWLDPPKPPLRSEVTRNADASASSNIQVDATGSAPRGADAETIAASDNHPLLP